MKGSVKVQDVEDLGWGFCGYHALGFVLGMKPSAVRSLAVERGYLEPMKGARRHMGGLFAREIVALAEALTSEDAVEIAAPARIGAFGTMAPTLSCLARIHAARAKVAREKTRAIFLGSSHAVGAIFGADGSWAWTRPTPRMRVNEVIFINI